jgi:hypothetical protein
VETSLDLGLASEAQILPTFRELYALRQNLDESRSALQALQLRLKGMIEPHVGV